MATDRFQPVNSAAKTLIREWINEQVEQSGGWPSTSAFEEFLRVKVVESNFHIFNCAGKSSLTRIKTLAARERRKSLDDDVNLRHKVQTYWYQHCQRLLPYAKVSEDADLLASSMSVLGLPPKDVNSFWLERRTAYVKVVSNPHRELGLQNCSGCGGVLTLVVGGKCLTATHKATVKAKALQAKQQKMMIEAKKKAPRKVICTKCGSFATLVPGETQPELDGLSDAEAIGKQLAWRSAKRKAFDIRCIQISNDLLCDVCSGIAGRKCPNCNCWDGPYVLHGCKKHKVARPVVPSNGRPCEGCVKDQRRYAALSQQKRTQCRHKEHRRLKRKMPAWKSSALEMSFGLIRKKRMRKEGVTRALEDLQGECNFLYPFVELQLLHKNWTNRLEYRIGYEWMRLYKSLWLKRFLSRLAGLVNQCRFFNISILKRSLHKRCNVMK